MLPTTQHTLTTQGEHHLIQLLQACPQSYNKQMCIYYKSTDRTHVSQQKETKISGTSLVPLL
jgi:hypothetical protein